MKKLKKRYHEILEKHDWSVSSYTGDGRVELEKYSPAVEDFIMCVEAENFPSAVMEYYEDFDVDEHIEMWVEATWDKRCSVRKRACNRRRGDRRNAERACIRTGGGIGMRYMKLTKAEQNRHPSIHYTGSVQGMKKFGYWGKNDRCVRCGQYIYNLSIRLGGYNRTW